MPVRSEMYFRSSKGETKHVVAERAMNTVYCNVFHGVGLRAPLGGVDDVASNMAKEWCAVRRSSPFRACRCEGHDGRNPRLLVLIGWLGMEEDAVIPRMI